MSDEAMLEIRAGRITTRLPLRLWLDRRLRRALEGSIYAETLAMIEPERSFRDFWRLVERHQRGILRP